MTDHIFASDRIKDIWFMERIEVIGGIFARHGHKDTRSARMGGEKFCDIIDFIWYSDPAIVFLIVLFDVFLGKIAHIYDYSIVWYI